MPLVYAPMCKECGKVKTTHPSGLCSRCRRTQKSGAICKVCGCALTKNESGICYECSRKLSEKFTGSSFNEYADCVIEGLRQSIFILERRKEGLSYADIAEMLGISPSVAFNREKRALRNEIIFAGGYDYIDGSYIRSAEEEAKAHPEKMLDEIPSLKYIVEHRSELETAFKTENKEMDLHPSQARSLKNHIPQRRPQHRKKPTPCPPRSPENRRNKKRGSHKRTSFFVIFKPFSGFRG